MSRNKQLESKSTITLTFSEQVENHVGMQKLGNEVKDGFSIEDLCVMSTKFKNCELIKLDYLVKDENVACLLIIRNGINEILDNDTSSDLLLKEQEQLNVDKQAYMKGRVVNKIARHNLCFGDQKQDPDYKNKKGTVIGFNQVPVLEELRNKLPNFFGEKARSFFVEGNYYYDIAQCYIGYHGDSERKRVIGARLGTEFPLHFQWYKKCKPIGEKLSINLNHGDIYVMSEKATGNDWKLRNSATLRHAAGLLNVLMKKTGK